MWSTVAALCRGVSCLLAGFVWIAGAGQAGAQSFLQPSVVPTGNWPAFVATADFNGDGRPDLLYVSPATSNSLPVTYILLGNGDGTFKAMPPVQMLAPAVAIGDFFGTGNLALASVVSAGTAGNNCPGGIEVVSAQGKGDGTFYEPYGAVFCPSGASQVANPGNVAAGKLISGGADSLLFTDAGNARLYTVNIASYTGNLSPAAPPFTPLPDGAGPIFVGDVNGDGNPDVVVNGLTNFAEDVFLGDGKGGLTRQQSFTGVFHSILLDRQNGVAGLRAEDQSGRINSLTWGGSGFSGETVLSALDGRSGNGGHLIGEADLNHDGMVDLLTATPTGVSVLLGGNNGFTLKGIYNAGPGGAAYALADFNGDGNLDLAVDSPEGIAILFGNKDGSFQTSQAFAAGHPAMSGALGKFTSSGHLDAVVGTAGAQGQLLLGQGDGTFVAQPEPTNVQAGVPGLVGTVLTGDFNGDGNLDIALTADGAHEALPATGSGIMVQFGDGKGGLGAPVSLTAPPYDFPNPATCTPPLDYFPGEFFGTSVVGDFNKDGITDIANLDVGAYRVMAGVGGAGSVPGLLWAESDDTSEAGDMGVDCDLDAHDVVTAGDLNNDGSPDLIFQDEGHLTIYTNDGTGHFATGAPDPRTLVLPDDLANAASELITPGQMAAPTLDTTFKAVGPNDTFSDPAFIGSTVVADLDGDGNHDLLVTYADLAANRRAPTTGLPNYLYIWFGSGGGKFLTSAKHPVNPVRIELTRNYYQMAVADLNGDGIPDLILSDGYLLDVQYGAGDGTFGAEHHFLAGQGMNSILVGDVNGDGAPDVVVANGGAVFGNPVANLDSLGTNPDVNTGGVTVLLGTKAAAPVTGTLVATPEPSAFEGAFTITATVPGSAGGTVQFSVDGTVLATENVTNGTATYPYAADPLSTNGVPLLPGSHVLGGVYNAPPATPLTALLSGTHTVSLAPTSVVLTPTTPLTTPYGGPANGTFVVNVLDQGNYPATGTWTQLSNGAAVPGCIALPLTQQCPYGAPNLLGAGSYVFTIAYNGDPVNAPSVSPPVTYVIQPDTTTAKVATSLTPATFGTAVTFTATLTGNMATPTGTVQFFDAGAVIGTGTLNASGQATFTTSTLAIGTHPISASYAATANFNAAVSPPLSQVIVPAAVPPTNPAPGWTLSAAPTTVSVEAGGTALLNVIVTETGGFASPVTLSCSGLPRETGCIFNVGTIAPGGGSTTLQFTTSGPHACGTNERLYLQKGPQSASVGGPGCSLRQTAAMNGRGASRGLELGGPVMAGLLLLWPRRRGARMQGILAALVMLSGLMALGGCGGNCTDLGTLPGNYTFAVTGTASGTGGGTQTVSVGVNVYP